jgi:hypothetical protein
MLGTEEAELKNQVALWPAALEISGIAPHRGTFSTAYAKFNLMVNGEGTCNASVTPQMLDLAQHGHDLVICHP